MTKILISYRGIPASPGWATGDLVFNAFKSLGHEVYTYGHYYEKSWSKPLPDSLTKEEVMRDIFDLVLYMEMNDPDPQYTELKHVRAKKRAYWDFDASYHLDQTLGLVNFMKFDHIFCANVLLKEQFGKYALTSILPYAFCMDKHVPQNKPRKTMRFAMIGNQWGERQEVFEALIRASIPVNVVVDKFREKYIEALASTHVCINHNVKSGRGLLVMRVFEALGAETCLLTNDTDGIREFLTPNKECLVYKDITDLVNICHCLNTPGGILAADRIAREGHENGMRKHTYHSRCQEILETLNLE